jgi:hypothetical protein
LARWLIEKWCLPKETADFISLGACGNVRQALLDAADFFTFGKTERHPKAFSLGAPRYASASFTR